MCWYVTRGGRGRRAHKPTEPQRSLRRFCCFGCPTLGFTRRACEERAWRHFDVPNSFFLPLFAFILAATILHLVIVPCCKNSNTRWPA